MFYQFRSRLPPGRNLLGSISPIGPRFCYMVPPRIKVDISRPSESGFNRVPKIVPQPGLERFRSTLEKAHFAHAACDSMRTTVVRLGTTVTAASLVVALLWGNSQAPSWNPKAAARYLDQRESWWSNWPPAARGQGTFCISCHTAATYALARPALRAELGENAISETERRLLENVRLRVRLWDTDAPFYTESSGPNKTIESRGTEAVLSALILAASDSQTAKLSDDARSAFRHLWSLQEKTGDVAGSWRWLNFGNEPFEAADSVFYGASLAALAVSMAPENYRATAEIQGNLRLLRHYLGREYTRAPLIHQVVALWAATKWAGLLDSSQQKSIVEKVLDKQQSAGGWGLSSLGWTWHGSSLRSLTNLWIRSNDSPLVGKSDAYATGLIVYVLGQAGLRRNDAHLQRGRSWLLRNQNPDDGSWPGYSLVNRRDSNSGSGLFMRDAATAYAVLALTALDGR